jgi:RNA polymerase sigma factor for flagellar operon FliA
MLHEQEETQVLDIPVTTQAASGRKTRGSGQRDACHPPDRHGRATTLQATPARNRLQRGGRCRETDHPEPALANAVNRAWAELKQSGSSAARDMLIIHYMAGHVRRVARRLSANLPRQVDPDDLSQHAYRVLTRLIDRFDPTQEVRFETFSTPRLSGAMRDYLRDLDTAGRQERQRCKKIHDTVQRHVTIHGRKPDAAELKSLLGIDNDQELHRWLEDARTPATVSFASGGRGGAPAGAAEDHFGDVDGFAGFADPRQPPPPSTAERDDLKRWLTTGLPRRDRLIIILYYYEQMTMKEIGQTLGCSESRVSQRLESILQCLRARLTRLNAAHELR